MVPEPVGEHLDAALAATAGDDLVDAAGGHRAAVVHPEPQLRPAGLRVPGPGADVPVEGAGGVVADLDRAGGGALAVEVDLTVPQIDIAALRVGWAIAEAREFGQADPVTAIMAIMAASRRCWNERPAQARSSRARSRRRRPGRACPGRAAVSAWPSVTDFSLAASHLKNCCSARNWLLAYAALYRSSGRTVHCCTSCLPTCSQPARPTSAAGGAANQATAST